MKSFRKLLQAALLLLPLLMVGGASAATDRAVVKREVDHLLDTLVVSKCQFNRNGDWYDGADAKSHLTKKYDYFLIRGEISSAESFIELAASKSSMSGRAYLVKCGDGKPMESGPWLKQELARYRMRLK
ncbi:MAG: DUF5329 domain-containing protein [Pseudomonadota bacterium]